MKADFDESIYGVMDVKMQCFRFKFFAATDKVAEREFGDSVNNPKSVFAQHPDDFALYLLGRFNSSHGDLIAVSPIILLGFASEFLQSNAAPAEAIQ